MNILGQENSGTRVFRQRSISTKVLTKVDKLYDVFLNSPTCTSLRTINASLCSSFIIKSTLSLGTSSFASINSFQRLDNRRPRLHLIVK